MLQSKLKWRCDMEIFDKIISRNKGKRVIFDIEFDFEKDSETVRLVKWAEALVNFAERDKKYD